MPNLRLTIELPIPASLEDEEIGQAVPDLVRALVSLFYPAPPDSLPDAKVEWGQE